MSHIFNRQTKGRDRREQKSSATAASELPAEFVELETFDSASPSTSASATAAQSQSSRDRLAGILQAERESLYASSPHSSIDRAAAKGRHRSYTDPTKVLVVVLLLGLIAWILPTTWIFGRRGHLPGSCCHHCAEHLHVEGNAHSQAEMPWQKEFVLPSRGKGCYLVTDDVVSQISEGLKETKVGILTLFIKHTSASLSLNENYDPTVRTDMTRALDHIVPEQGGIRWEHTDEGLDDSASHTKASLFGSSVTVPITNGRINVGTWQGIYLCEWREMKHSRKIVATILP